MVNTKQIEEKLVQRVAAILSTDAVKVKPETPLHTLGMDSLGFVELLVFIEKEFKIKLMESGLEREDFKTIRALAQRISKVNE
ncbi:MAG TPA: acyl carrier protein [Candidatus Hydrogenedentes bacterium]|nr:acyl carrier protein [Candidatus Hydrogenedentota bacterium]